MERNYQCEESNDNEADPKVISESESSKSDHERTWKQIVSSCKDIPLMISFLKIKIQALLPL